MRVQELSTAATGNQIAVIRIGKGELKILYDLVKEASLTTPKVTDTLIFRSDLGNLQRGLGKSLEALGYVQPKLKIKRP